MRATPQRKLPTWCVLATIRSCTGLNSLRSRDWQRWTASRDRGGLPIADDLYDQVLDATVDQSPRSLGQRISSWTRRSLGTYLSERLKVAVGNSTIGRHLHRLGWTLNRPVLTICSPDPTYADKADELVRLQDQAKRGEIVLLYEDEVDLNLLPGVVRCWTRKGEQRKIPTPGTNKKRYGFGAVNFVTGELTTQIGEHKNSKGFGALIEAMVARYRPDLRQPGPKIVVVVDNYIIHRSKITNQVLTTYADRLEVYRLPTYAPKLNVIEWLWKELRAKVTHNHPFPSIEALVKAVADFFADLVAAPQTVLSIIGNSGQQGKHKPNLLCSPI